VAFFLSDEVGLSERLILPRRAWDCAVVGPAPYLRPLQAVLDEFRRIAVVVIDSRHAEISSYYMGEILDRKVIEAEELRKTNLVLVGGHHDATQALLPYLEPRVGAITETFVVDLHTLTEGTLIKRVAELEESYERREETREVDEVYSLAGAGDLSAIGVDRVFEAASHHAITRLLVHDGAVLEGSVCTSCGSLSRPSDICLRCGRETRPLYDAIEALSRAVIEARGSVEHVMSETRLAEDLVAARLRFAPW
jgi:peptide chain release factor subunit 1